MKPDLLIAGLEAIQLAEKSQPDVILMDLQMSGMGGLGVIRQIVQTSPHNSHPGSNHV